MKFGLFKYGVIAAMVAGCWHGARNLTAMVSDKLIAAGGQMESGLSSGLDFVVQKQASFAPGSAHAALPLSLAQEQPAVFTGSAASVPPALPPMLSTVQRSYPAYDCHPTATSSLALIYPGLAPAGNISPATD